MGYTVNDVFPLGGNDSIEKGSVHGTQKFSLIFISSEGSCKSVGVYFAAAEFFQDQRRHDEMVSQTRRDGEAHAVAEVIQQHKMKREGLKHRSSLRIPTSRRFSKCSIFLRSSALTLLRP